MASVYIKLPSVPAPVVSSSGVTSFKGRSGVVVPAAGDYAGSQVSYTGVVPESTVSDAIDWMRTHMVDGPFDPTTVSNNHYQYLQGTVQTTDDSPTVVYSDTVSGDGIYLYEAKVVGVEVGAVGAPDNAVFKRSFTVYKEATNLTILDIQSDYSHKTDSSWSLSVTENSGDIILTVVGSVLETVKWAATITKTMNLQGNKWQI